jgi:hypothetical protein
MPSPVAQYQCNHQFNEESTMKNLISKCNLSRDGTLACKRLAECHDHISAAYSLRRFPKTRTESIIF